MGDGRAQATRCLVWNMTNPQHLIRCEACQKRFKIPESMYERHVAGRLATTRCKYCNASIQVDGRNHSIKAALPPPPRPLVPQIQPPRTMLDSISAGSPPESEAGYWVVSLPEKDAEMTFPELANAIKQTHIPPDTLLWRPGMREWQRAKSVPALGGLFRRE